MDNDVKDEIAKIDSLIEKYYMVMEKLQEQIDAYKKMEDTITNSYIIQNDESYQRALNIIGAGYFNALSILENCHNNVNKLQDKKDSLLDSLEK